MMDLIQQVTKQLGVDETAARSLTGGLLGMIKQQASDGDFSELMTKLPGASEMVQEPAAASTGGGLGRMAQGLMHTLAGEKAGGALDVVSLFKQSGLGQEQGKKFISMFVEFIKGKAGSELTTRLTDQVPALKALLG